MGVAEMCHKSYDKNLRNKIAAKVQSFYEIRACYINKLEIGLRYKVLFLPVFARQTVFGEASVSCGGVVWYGLR